MRTVVSDDRFDAARDGITPDIERWDEVFRGVEGALAWAPELGQATSAQGIYALPTEDWPGVPPLVVYYRFDEKEVTLLDIREADSEPSHEDE